MVRKKIEADVDTVLGVNDETIKVEIPEIAPFAEEPAPGVTGEHDLRHNGRFVSRHADANAAQATRDALFPGDETATVEPRRAWEVHSEEGFHDSFHSQEEADAFIAEALAKRQARIDAGQNVDNAKRRVASGYTTLRV